MADRSTPNSSAKTVARTSMRTSIRIATIVFFGTIGFSVFRALLVPMQPGKHPFDWTETLRFSLLFGVVSFIALFVWNQATAAIAQPGVDILREAIASADLDKVPMSGFVAMEYYWLAMNRTYVIFIAPEGLYGWLAQGPVAAPKPGYFEPYAQMLRNEVFMRNHAAVQKLSRLRGGFFLGRSEIASVEDDDCKKWGMGGLPHTGTIRVHLVSGTSREFIVLGNTNTGRIRHKLISIMGVKASPVD